MNQELTSIAESLYEMELPGDPRSGETRTALLETITGSFPQAEFAGHGRGRVVVWLPALPHRKLTKTEREAVHDGIVVKFAYNAADQNDGQRQNRTEADIWENGSPVIDSEHLAPVFDVGPEQKWLVMPYRELIPRTAQFEDRMLAIFGELPTGDLGAKSSWGFAGDGSIECCDYGRCPTTTADNPTSTNANVTV